jgi:hypothetical protein
MRRSLPRRNGSALANSPLTFLSQVTRAPVMVEKCDH